MSASAGNGCGNGGSGRRSGLGLDNSAKSRRAGRGRVGSSMLLEEEMEKRRRTLALTRSGSGDPMASTLSIQDSFEQPFLKETLDKNGDIIVDDNQAVQGASAASDGSSQEEEKSKELGRERKGLSNFGQGDVSGTKQPTTTTSTAAGGESSFKKMKLMAQGNGTGGLDGVTSQGAKVVQKTGRATGSQLLKQLHEAKKLNYENPSVSIFKRRKLIGKITNHLDFQSVLTCRQVCKQWLLGVNSFLEARTDSNGVSLRDNLVTKYTFSRMSTVTNFIRKYETVVTNPIIGRSVKFQIDEKSFSINERLWMNSEDFSIAYWNLVKDVLQKFGQHIWYVTIAQFHLALTPHRLYVILQQSLPYMPNLKELVVDGAILPLPPNFEDSNIMKDYAFLHDNLSRRNALKEVMNYGQPLPTLPNLESFQFLIGDGISREIQIRILEKCIGKSSSKLSGFGTATFSIQTINKLPLEKLKSITVIERHDNSYHVLDQYLRHVKPGTFADLELIKPNNLQKLTLMDDTIKLGDVLRLLGHFVTVRDLHLEGLVKLPIVGDYNQPNRMVKTLKIKHEYYGLVSTDRNFYAKILMHLPNLTHIHMIEKRPSSGNFTGVHEQLSFPLGRGNGDMYGLPVWRQYPSLDIIKLEQTWWEGRYRGIKTWTRLGYENVLKVNSQQNSAPI